MQIANTKQAYGWAAIALHWIAGIGVISLYVIGFLGGRAEDAHDRAGHMLLMGLHISLGAILLIFAFARVFWHLAQTRPEEPAQPAPLALLARWTPRLLLLAIVVQFTSGPLLVWAGAHPIHVFDWFAIPSPFASRQTALDHYAGIAHYIGRNAILVLVPLHILGALKHLVIDRDGAFQRIVWPAALKRPA
jgi:cytochrome b561